MDHSKHVRDCLLKLPASPELDFIRDYIEELEKEVERLKNEVSSGSGATS